MSLVTGPGLAVQLYTLRDSLDQDLEAALAALAAAGVRDVELAGLHGRSGSAMRAALDSAGLAACSAHVPLERLRAGARASSSTSRGARGRRPSCCHHPATTGRRGRGRDPGARRRSCRRGRRRRARHRVPQPRFRVPPADDGADLWTHRRRGLSHEPDDGKLQVAEHDPVAILGGLDRSLSLVRAKDVRRGARALTHDVVGRATAARLAAAIAAAATAGGAAWLVVKFDRPSPIRCADVARRSKYCAARFAAAHAAEPLRVGLIGCGTISSPISTTDRLELRCSSSPAPISCARRPSAPRASTDWWRPASTRSSPIPRSTLCSA